MATVYLALGSNLGDRHSNIRRAIDLLNIAGVHIKRLSTIIETEPVGGPAQGKFLNAVLEAHTELSARQLHSKTKDIEAKLGRVHREVDGPREIDIDILLYDDLVLDFPDLTIPHPRMSQRDFVMGPLKEIAPHIAEALTRAHH